MAHGLIIDNGDGKRVIDSEYRGIHYVGKQDISSPQVVQIPGYTNSTLPPLIFIKYPTSAGQFASMNSLKFLSPIGSVGGAGSITTVDASNNVYAFSAGQGDGAQGGVSQALCESVGGEYVSGAIGGCRRIAPLNVAMGQDSSGKEGVVNLTFSAGGVISSSTVAESGSGWSVGDTTDLAAGGGIGFLPGKSGDQRTEPTLTGWYCWNTSTLTWGAKNSSDGSFNSSLSPTTTINSLASGWSASISGNFTDIVSVYYYGVGGLIPTGSDQGLEIRNDAGDTTFSTNRPPPNVRGSHNVSFTGLEYSTSVNTSNSPAGLSYPASSTAMFAPTLMPTSYYGVQAGNWSNCGLNIPASLDANTWEVGIGFNTSGGTVTGLTAGGYNQLVSIGFGTYTSPSKSVKVHAPLWTITSGPVNGITQSGAPCQFVNSPTQTWDVNTDCLFIDTTLPDSASMSYLDFT